MYPRIFTYSADYPEKSVSMLITLIYLHHLTYYRVLLATIRDNGLFPCPRCLVPKSAIYKLGCLNDILVRIENFRTYMANQVKKARVLIYKHGKPITGSGVDGLLKDFSGVPTMVR